VFKLDLISCENCGGQVRVLACIEDPLVIGKILAHLETQPPVVVCSARTWWDGGNFRVAFVDRWQS
jgi:hypothetical protein